MSRTVRDILNRVITIPTKEQNEIAIEIANNNLVRAERLFNSLTALTYKEIWNDKDFVDDYFSESFLVMCRATETFNVSRGDFCYHYLYKLKESLRQLRANIDAVSSSYYLKTTHRLSTLSIDTKTAEGGSIGETLTHESMGIDRQLAIACSKKRIMRELPDRRNSDKKAKEAFIKYYIEGHNMEDIGISFGVSKQSISNWISKCRDILIGAIATGRLCEQDFINNTIRMEMN